MSRLSSVVISGPASSITLPVKNAKLDDRYILMGATGLGPPEIDIAMGQSVYRGGVFQGSAPKDREIVFLVGLNPNYDIPPTNSIAELRDTFYNLISGPIPLTVALSTIPSAYSDSGPPLIYAYGYIRRIEIAPFSKDQQLQVTIICPSPYFSDPMYTDLTFVPEENAVTTEFEYDGTAIVGFEWNFELFTDTSAVVVTAVANNRTSEMETLHIPGPRVAGEQFQVNTSADARSVYWTNPLIPTAYGDITGMCTVTPDRWPSIHPGLNVLEVRDGANLPLNITSSRLRFIKKYWGI